MPPCYPNSETSKPETILKIYNFLRLCSIPLEHPGVLGHSDKKKPSIYEREVHSDLIFLVDRYPNHVDPFLQRVRNQFSRSRSRPSAKDQVIWKFLQSLKDFLEELERREEIESSAEDGRDLDSDKDDVVMFQDEERENSPTPQQHPISKSGPPEDARNRSGKRASTSETAVKAKRAAIVPGDRLVQVTPAIARTSTPPKQALPMSTGATRDLRGLEIGSARIACLEDLANMKVLDFSSVAPKVPSHSKSNPVRTNQRQTHHSDWHADRPLIPPPESEAYIEIVPMNRFQGFFNKQNIGFNVQWELERQIASHPTAHWGDFQPEDLQYLSGPASKSFLHIASVIEAAAQRRNGQGETTDSRPETIPLNKSRLSPAVSPVLNRSNRLTRILSEMDSEEASIMAENLSGLGNESRDWPYGGRLVYVVSVQYQSNIEEGVRPMPIAPPDSQPNPYRRSSSRNSLVSSHADGPIDPPANPFGPRAVADAEKNPIWPFKFVLRTIDMPGRSTRLARRFGSRRVLTLQIRDVPRHARNKLFDMLCGCALIIFGRVYRALWAPPEGETVTAIQTEETVPGAPLVIEPTMPSFLALLSRYNEIGAKPNQAMAKWVSRWQLLLSDSVPATHVNPGAIDIIHDIICASADQSNPTTTDVLTDGCGLMSESLARQIFLHPNMQQASGHPCTVQMRLGGAKGLLAIMSADQAKKYPGKDVLLRPSMIKSLPAEVYAHDPSLFTLDVLRVDGMKLGSNLSSEPIIIMEHNGVPASVLLRIAERSLDDLRLSFFPYTLEGEDELDTTQRLLSATYQLGGVGTERRKRDCIDRGQSTKVAGLTFDASGGTGDDIMDDEKEDQPGSLAEQLYETLLAGFRPTPQNSAYTASKLRYLVGNLAESIVRQFKLPVEQSLSAFIVPDTLGVLAPDEIFVSCSSEQPVDPVTQRRITYLQGDCLVYRSPCKLPTDVRKFRAVVRPELFHLRDCIVLSANSSLCTRSPASFLGGGDYDGDTATVIWDQELVEPFVNAPDECADPPALFESTNFVKEVLSAREFFTALEGFGDNARIINAQHFLLGAVKDQQQAGIYSGLHDNSVYTNGCDDPSTLRLAHMFCTTLDARKSGLCVRSHVFREDRQRFSGKLEWRCWKKGEEAVDEFNLPTVARPKELGIFIMDQIRDAGQEKKAAIMADFREPGRMETLVEGCAVLGAQYNDLTHRAKESNNDELLEQLQQLELHVKTVRSIWNNISNSDNDDWTVADLYRSGRRGQPVPRTPKLSRSAFRSGKSGSSISGGASNAGRVKTARAIELKRIRELTIIWRNGLTVDEVPLLAPYGRVDFLAELKVSCMVHLLAHEHKRIYLPFELDFSTVCRMMARATGLTRTIPASTATRLRPLGIPNKK